MTVACLIARTNSTRLPEKVLLPIGRRLLIEHIIDRLKMVPNIDRIYVCTSTELSDQRLAAIAERNGVHFYAGSPDSPLERMLEVARRERADCLIRVTGDNVFTDPVYLSEVTTRHQRENAEYTRMMGVPLGLGAEAVSMDALERCAATIDPRKSEYLMLYLFQPSAFRCQVVLPEPDLRGERYSVTVDTPADLERSRYIAKELSHMGWIRYDSMLALNERSPIPHFHFSHEGRVRMPDGRFIRYAEFLADMERRMSLSTKTELEDGHYDSGVALLNS